MKKKSFHTGLALFILMIFSSTYLKAQYNNEWIDYNKAYYKFKVGENGLYRIPFSTLQANGLANTPAEHFQLWRNGKEVPLFTSKTVGVLTAADFIEFFGQMNDGKADAVLYKKPEFQLSDKWSLQTDTAAYFLTVNASASNARVLNALNNTASNTLPIEPYFMHRLERNFKDQLNPGYASIVGIYVYSSSYDNGEGWSSRNVQPGSPLVEQYNNLAFAPEGPDARLQITAFGNALNARKLQVSVNGTQIIDQSMDYFTAAIQTTTVQKTLLGRAVDTIRIHNASLVGSDRITLGKYELVYPRKFDFGGNGLFEFTLPGTSVGNYLEVTNFRNNAVAPVLYALSEGKRYVADMTVPGKFRFALPAGGERNFVMLDASAAAVKLVAGMTKRNFVDYAASSRQGNYLMIAHSSLSASSNGDAIQNYKNYRSSNEGGKYQVGIYDIDELVDQFAFGIKKHPLSIKNFIAFAKAYFSINPQHVLLLGKGVTYDQYRYNESKLITERINLVPTFGNPGSDNILASSDNDATPEIPVGRLSVTTGDEINAYLEKVKQHDKSLLSINQTVKDKAWMKNFAHVIGGGDPYLQNLINNYMKSAGRYVEDASYGAKVYTFEKITSAGVDLVNSGMLGNLFTEGLGVLTYFGHSSANSMEFNLDDPSIFDNAGKYPLFIANGCNAGNFFIYDTLRATAGKKSITENYVLMPGKGSIGFIASTHYGIVNYLNLYTSILYKRMAQDDYSLTIGQLMTNVLREVIAQGGNNDYYNVLTVEQMLLGGDPAVFLYPHALPDYVVEDPLVKISPTSLSVSNANFDLKVKFQNIGKATQDSVLVHVKRELPDGTMVDLYKQKRTAVYFADSILISVPINPYKDRGQNKIHVTIDPDDKINEISNANNSISKIFTIAEDEVRPVYPIQFAIVNTPSIKLTATTNQFLSAPAQFLLEVDTTEYFNSPIKVMQTQTSLGGIIEFNPTLQLRDSLVFYWRVAKKPDTGVVNKWSNSSFVYLSKSGAGWSQSHYFQYLKGNYYNSQLETDRSLQFGFKQNSLKILTQLYPNGFSTVANNLNNLYSSSCFNALNSFEFVLIDSKTGFPKINGISGGQTLFNSIAPARCAFPQLYQYWYNYNNRQSRNNAKLFVDGVENSTILLLLNWGSLTNNSNPEFVDKWISDTLENGKNNSIYHTLKSIGFSKIDSFYRNIPFCFVAIKNENGVWEVLRQTVGNGPNDFISENIPYYSKLTSGAISNGIIGPAKSWSSIHWTGNPLETNSADEIKYKVYGLQQNFSESLLYSSSSKIKDTSMAFINAKNYPYLRVEQENKDTVNNTPWQQRYLQVKYDPVPEGALTMVSNIPMKDTLEVGEPMKFKMAFKNISPTAFDSVRLFMTSTDPSNNTKVLYDGNKKSLITGDTIMIDQTIDTKNLVGDNAVYINFNPNNAQPEQYLFNNYLNKNIYVRPDTYAPNLDVTFDGVHILNKDIVSPKPNIFIKLKDDSRYLALNDTSLFSIRLVYPDGQIRSIF
ncbi:MAG: C25 family cysteine peptidase [Chitinophagaceae bacterium]|nr:C25 family cysteine peptidase [Chitinophagaceae bacterium]